MNYKKQSNHLLSVAIQTKANDDNSLRLSGKPYDSRNWQTEIKSIRKSSKTLIPQHYYKIFFLST